MKPRRLERLTSYYLVNMRNVTYECGCGAKWHDVGAGEMAIRAYCPSHKKKLLTPLAELRMVLQAAVDWNDEYKKLNNLSGDPHWVSWARKVLPKEK